MCGIGGIYAYHPCAGAVKLPELRRISAFMANRGPDGFGEWMTPDGRMAVCHRRLSIIDLSERAAQPMVSADGRYVITFNGEIYNYRSLRADLERKGYQFRSDSDTEVLLHLYDAEGVAMLPRLRGMFAFAILETESRRIVLVRDPFGVKPLYFADDGWTLRFASQTKALLAGGGISREKDPAGWVGFYLFGSVPDPLTTIRDVRSLPAGSYMIVDGRGANEAHQYFSVGALFRNAENDRGTDSRPSDVAAEIRDSLLDSVRHHLVADVAVGAFLSAGVDSGALVGLMRDAGADDVQTVTLAFDEFRGSEEDEAPLAGEVAKKYGVKHVVRTVTEQEFRADLPAIFDSMDLPSIDGVNTWFVSKAARELGLKVAVSGLGGDELFGGYDSFRTIPRWVAATSVPSRVPMIPSAAGWAVSLARRRWGRIHPKAAGFLRYGGSYAGAYLLQRGLYLPEELGDVLDHDTLRDGAYRFDPLEHLRAALSDKPRSPFGKVATLECSMYMRNQLLRDADWASMAHSLEVRVPFVDPILVQRLVRVAAGRMGNSLKAELAAAPQSPLPSAVTSRRKTGFGTPVSRWQRKVCPPHGNPASREVSIPWARSWAVCVASGKAPSPQEVKTEELAA